MIKCEGLRENNLKNITVSFPENRITAVVGVSGSGKSSFAFDSVYAENQRIFFELMFPQASEMRLKHTHPNLDRITPILPAISMKQAKNNFNPRSTVGTYTGISGILRTFFSSVLKESSGGSVSTAMLSPNTSAGACPVCKGLGYVATIDINAIVDTQRSIENGGIKIWKNKSNSDYYKQLLIAVCHELEIDTTVPVEQLRKEQLDQLLAFQGEIIVTIRYRTLKGGIRTKKARFSGILHELETYAKKHSISEILCGGYHNYFTKSTCPSCEGKRVRAEVEQWKVCGLSFASVELLSLKQLKQWLLQVQNEYTLPKSLQNVICILNGRIASLERCELGYLSLSRSIPTLSGGEYQRLRLSLALSTDLSNMLFIFDEPSAGLHPQNVEHIRSLMDELKAHNNTVLVVEHNPAIVKNSDYVIEFGPQAGEQGGYTTFSGPTEQFLEKTDSYSPSNEEVLYSSVREKSLSVSEWIDIGPLLQNNVDLEKIRIPLKNLIAIVGVSGAGKSSLLQAIRDRLDLMGKARKVCVLSQRPIGKNIRSTVATYLGIFDDIRQLFASENPTAPSQIFSYNSKLGQCPYCKGTGIQTFDLDFMPDEDTVCPNCNGSRYSKTTESYTFRGRSIAQVLNMSIDAALEFFSDKSEITKRLLPLQKIGLGYIHIGQSSNSLSGGESQRVKLGKVLQKASHVGMFYLLDEPTSGLHMKDIHRLLAVFHDLRIQGATILIAEHTTQVICASDYIIELGTGGGETGGKIIATGSPEEIKLMPFSMIAKFL